jgi:hypothetical protein
MTIPHLSGADLPIVFLEGSSGFPVRPEGIAPNVGRSRKVVCPDPGFKQVRDKEVQSGSVNFKGNFVPDEWKLVGTQRKSLAISESLQ